MVVGWIPSESSELHDWDYFPVENVAGDTDTQ